MRDKLNTLIDLISEQCQRRSTPIQFLTLSYLGRKLACSSLSHDGYNGRSSQQSIMTFGKTPEG